MLLLVGDAVCEKDVKAKFENSVLRISSPKKKPQKLPEKRLISIEG